MPLSKRVQTAKGFTLVELLVVIAIIGILAAVVLVALNPLALMQKGRDATRMQDLESLRKAIDLAIADSSITLTAVASSASNAAGATRAVDGTGWVSFTQTTAPGVGKYLSVLPVDPTNSATYHYVYASDGSTYELDTKFESADYLSKTANDGGNDPNWYEVGTTPGLTLLAP